MYSQHPQTLMIARGYTADERIQYDAALVVLAGELVFACEQLFANPAVAFIDIRYAATNCFQFRVNRG
ncbi:DUF1203 domain-containing protein [Porticoccaceae bacterium]|nr:DUF1203 domain-containing protein [Porticoccaceae bacterium]